MIKQWLYCAALTAGLTYLSDAESATKHHRLIWDSDPSSNAVIGFSPDGSSQSPYVTFGFTTNESSWQVATIDDSKTFRSSLVSYFVRLTNLPANSAVYYRVCDDAGCGQRFWFKTAPTDQSPYIAVAGGDTRTGWTTRRKGNQLISKIRPLFIMHGGDFTNANNASEMNEFLSDWQLTHSSDTIDGLNYKRIYPLIPTHGNHEDNNYKTLCEVFGTDYNQDGNCSPSDTYGAFNISPLLRVYTLNSQFKNSGWSSYASAMNNWLSNDLASQGSSALWRFAQYHKPMFPHYTGKSENQILFDWWADDFYNRAMNLVVESDTHINKMTQSIRPSGNNFTSTTSGGTVYVGEGSWGAPARSANDPKSWTIDLASIQQFKVITVAADGLQVRTAQFDESASTLSRQQRLADPTVLPDNVNWWHANGVGESLNLVRNADNRTVIDTGNSSGDTLTLEATDDTFIAKSQATTNFDDSNEGLLADGSDSTYGVMDSLIKWDVSSLPDCAIITSAQVVINIFNRSTGSYNLHAGNNNWVESTATWNSVSGSAQQGALVGSFTPSTTGSKTITLNSAGLSMLQNWLQGGNYGIVITSAGTSDGIDFDSKETGLAPQLIIYYETSDNCEPPTSNNELTNDEPKTDLASGRHESQLFYLDVPETATSLSFTISGGSGDADMYVRFGSEPTTDEYDCRPYRNGNEEVCVISNLRAGRYFVMLYGYSAFDGVSLVGRYAEGDDTSGDFSKLNLADSKGRWLHYSVQLPEGVSNLSVTISGGNGDADLYVRRGAQPTLSTYDCRPWRYGNNESCSESSPQSGLWYFSLYGYDAYSGVDLIATWQ